MNPTRALVDTMREDFTRRISMKTGWGCHEILREFECALQEGLLKSVEVLTIKGGLQ